jgi:hypothetical protein
LVKNAPAGGESSAISALLSSTDGPHKLFLYLVLDRNKANLALAVTT